MAWFNVAPVLSHNCFINFVLGPRGGGKTFNTLLWAGNDFVKNGNEFMYIRRTEAELMLAKPNLFSAIKDKGYLEDYIIKTDGNTVMFNDKIGGHAYALSTAHKLKSTAFPKVDKIIFDEFLVEAGRTNYLSNEVEMFLSLLETVFRGNDNARVLLLANSVTINNKYFEYFKISPKRNSKFTTMDDLICVNFYRDEDYINSRKETKLGRLVSGTHYGAYMYDNEFLKDNYDFVEPMTGNGVYQFTMAYDGSEYGAYWQPEKGIYHVNHAVNPSCKTIFSFTTEDHKPNFMLFKSAKQNPFIKRLKYCFDMGNLYFDSLSTKQAMYELFDYL